MDVNPKKTEEPTSARTPMAPASPSLAPTGRGASLQAWRDEFDRLFDSFLDNPFSRRLMELDPFRRRGLVFGDVTPRVDVRETAAAIEITAELPGLKEEDVEITVGEGMLTLRGDKKVQHEQTEGGYHMSERSYGSFARSFPLPDTVDEAGIEAVFERGVVKITLPKTEKSPPQRRKIEVKAKS